MSIGVYFNLKVASKPLPSPKNRPFNCRVFYASLSKCSSDLTIFQSVNPMSMQFYNNTADPADYYNCRAAIVASNQEGELVGFSSLLHSQWSHFLIVTKKQIKINCNVEIMSPHRGIIIFSEVFMTELLGAL